MCHLLEKEERKNLIKFCPIGIVAAEAVSASVFLTHLSSLSICGDSNLQHSVHLYIIWIK